MCTVLSSIKWGCSENGTNHEAISKGWYDTRGSTKKELNKVLMQYRIMLHTITGVSPSSLFMGHNIRTRLDFLHLNVASGFQNKQLIQKDSVDIYC